MQEIWTLLGHYGYLHDRDAVPLQTYMTFLRKLCRDILAHGEKEGRHHTHPAICDIISHMYQRYTGPWLSMSSIADEYGISAVRLPLDFMELSGMTPSEYLFYLRMGKAN